MGSMLSWVCTVTASNRSQQTSHQNVMGTSVTHSAAPLLCHFSKTLLKRLIYITADSTVLAFSAVLMLGRRCKH